MNKPIKVHREWLPNPDRRWWQFWKPREVFDVDWSKHPGDGPFDLEGVTVRIWSTDHFSQSVRTVRFDAPLKKAMK